VTESSSRAEFSRVVARPDAEVDVARAALLVACEEYPQLDVEAWLGRLDEMGAAFRARRGGAGFERAVHVLNRYLFEEEGFRGNDEEYYDPRNSFLNDVLERRTGIPITLSLVYIEVARRGGLRVDGVGLPGHFIVRAEEEGGQILVDPYYRGRILTSQDCQKRLDAIFGGKLRLEPQMLAPASGRQILARILNNLKAIYVKAEDHARALFAVELLLRLNPDSAEDLRDRGLLHSALGCYSLAARDLEAYLSAVPGAPEADDLLNKIVEMRQRAERLH
jgi:regulator of sirC expression with transglutaminase-like and TPR domain